VTLTGNIGDSLTTSVAATTVAGITGPASPPSAPVKLLSAGGDEDGDGQSNAAEQTAGTDALSPASLFKITSFASTSGQVTVSTNSVSGKTYRLWTSISLKADEWFPLGESKSGTGGAITFSDTPAPGDPKRFYRVGVE